jgi:hypothetical protein
MHWELIKDWGLAQWARPILNVVFDSASEAADYELRHLLGPERYHRFQVAIPSASRHLDDASPENLARLRAEAETMIAAHAAEFDHLSARLAR